MKIFITFTPRSKIKFWVTPQKSFLSLSTFRWIKVFFMLIFFFIVTSSCTRDLSNAKNTALPVLSTLFNNRMLLLMRGTYATDNPLEFSEINGNQLYRDLESEDPAYDLGGVPAYSDLPVYLDIGEVRIASSYQPGGLEQIQSIRDSAKFWDFIAPERQVYCSIPYTLFTNSCERNSGLLRYAEFMSPQGSQYPSNDPTADARGYSGTQYYHAGMYLRSLVTGFAKEGGAPVNNTRFDSRIVTGTNIVPRNSYKPGASDVEKQSLTPLMYPIFYTVGVGHDDLTIRPGFDPYILEMRVNMKEMLMIHSWVSFFGNIQTMVGFSDWKFGHAGQADMGGNVLLRARVIYPEFSSALTITGGSRDLRAYYVIYRAGEEVGETNIKNPQHLPLIATPIKGSSSRIKYIHKGDYRLFCVKDESPLDGFPEKYIRDTYFSVSDAPRQELTVELACP